MVGFIYLLRVVFGSSPTNGTFSQKKEKKRQQQRKRNRAARRKSEKRYTIHLLLVFICDDGEGEERPQLPTTGTNKFPPQLTNKSEGQRLADSVWDPLCLSLTCPATPTDNGFLISIKNKLTFLLLCVVTAVKQASRICCSFQKPPSHWLA